MLDDRSVSVHCITLMPRPKFQLVCFPPAGEGVSYYRSISEALAPSTEVLSVQYPQSPPDPAGGDALQSPSSAHLIAETLVDRLDSPTVLFGQGLGATVAFEVAHSLELAFLLNDRSGGRLAALLVSSQPAPCDSLAKDAAITCPIGVFLGDADPFLSYDEATAWAYHSKERFDCQMLHGGKDYFRDRPAELVNAISDYLLMLD